MANRRILSWSTSMRDMRDSGADRAGRASIREERLRVTVGLREPAGLTSWRGRSGRRYVVGVHDLDEIELAELTSAVLIAVERRPDGSARVLSVAAPRANTSPRVRQRWLSRVSSRGATEMHIHRLAESEAERRAVVADLMERAS
jgi:hypothetical protein